MSKKKNSIEINLTAMNWRRVLRWITVEAWPFGGVVGMFDLEMSSTGRFSC
jgi:hypothetical protein